MTLVVSRLISTGNLQNLPKVSWFAYLVFKRPAVDFLFAVRDEEWGYFGQTSDSKLVKLHMSDQSWNNSWGSAAQSFLTQIDHES